MTILPNTTDIFTPIVGPDHIHPASPEDAIDGIQPQFVVAPGSAEEVAAVLRAANEAGLAVIPRGGGTKLAWGNTPRRADIVLSTERLNQLVEHAHGDMTATAQAGITIGALQNALAEHGQMLALDPPWPERATLGGVIAADSAGPLRIRYGSLRDLVLGVTVALPDGTLAKSGGKVVKNVAGYDLMKLMTGSLGTLGVITSATLRLHPVPSFDRSLYLRTTEAETASEFVLALNHSPLTPVAAQIVSTDEGYGVCVRFAGVEASVQAQSRYLRALAPADKFTVRELDQRAANMVWQAHAHIYRSSAPAIVGRLSVLPTHIGATLNMIEDLASRLRVENECVIFSNGTGFVRWQGTNEQALSVVASVARTRLLERGGSFVLHHVPPELKQKMDVWGSGGDTLPLMRRVKQQFDARGTLNPGRYLGRI